MCIIVKFYDLKLCEACKNNNNVIAVDAKLFYALFRCDVILHRNAGAVVVSSPDPLPAR